MQNIYIGTAGFSYPDWNGIAYPKPHSRDFNFLSYLSQFVDIIEINTTFYTPPDLKIIKKWLSDVADREKFLFSLKLGKDFTHSENEFKSVDIAPYKNALFLVQEEARLCALLAQFPFSFKAEEKNFKRLEKLIESFNQFPLVLELRHSSWRRTHLLNWLKGKKEKNVEIALTDQPGVSSSLNFKLAPERGFYYIRLHGRNKENWFRESATRDERYDYLYSQDELLFFVNRIKESLKGKERVFIIANNHFRAKGLANAIELRYLFTGKKQKAPKSLIEHYPRLGEFCIPDSMQGELFFNS